MWRGKHSAELLCVLRAVLQLAGLECGRQLMVALARGCTRAVDERPWRAEQEANSLARCWRLLSNAGRQERRTRNGAS